MPGLVLEERGYEPLHHQEMLDQMIHAPEMVGYMRPAESEIYGRSLSTIRRLGAFMVDQSSLDSITSPEADQARVEFYTSVEEGFGTDMELGGGLEVRDFDERPVIDGRVMSKDLKTPVSSMTEAGLTCAEKTAKEDHRFLPQLTRSEWDHSNALIVDKMARGETNYNTRIVVSPFPEEAAAISGDDYWRSIGYVPHLRRGFVQLYYANGTELVTGSLSFDGGGKEKLQEIFAQHDVEIPQDEVTDNWLQYAITGTMPEDQAKSLATAIADQAGNTAYKKTTNTVDVTEEYGTIMDQVFNESYVHVCESLFRGYQTEGAGALILQLADKAHHFNDRYAKALYKMRANKGQFTDDDSIVLHELLVYSTIEMMRALHLKEQKVPVGHTYSGHNNTWLTAAHLESLDTASFQSLLGGFGATGAQNGRTYSACGLSISPGTNKEPQSPFGGQDTSQEAPKNDEEGKSKKKWMNCPHCSAKVYDDPCASFLFCGDCRAMVINGVTFKGNGGSKQRETERAKRRAATQAEKKEELDSA